MTLGTNSLERIDDICTQAVDGDEDSIRQMFNIARQHCTVQEMAAFECSKTQYNMTDTEYHALISLITRLRTGLVQLQAGMRR